MAAPVVCAAASSLLPSLEPIAGAAIAINLAYLNLPVFAYIGRVKDTLSKRLNAIDKNVRTQLAETTWFKQMTSLSEVDTLDLQRPNLKTPYISAPGLWGAAYNFLFYWRMGRALSIVSTAYALFVLVLGSAHNSKWTGWGACFFGDAGIGTHLGLITFALMWPIIVVMVGGWVCSEAVSFVNHYTGGLKTQALEEAEETLAATAAATAAANAAQSRAPGDRPTHVIVRADGSLATRRLPRRRPDNEG